MSADARRMRVTALHVHNSRTVGGVETSLVGWARHLDPRRFAARIFCFEESDGTQRPFLRYLERRKLSARVLPWGGRKRVIRAVAGVIEAIHESRPCVVHTHDLRPDVVGWLAARLTGCAWIASVHAWHSEWPGLERKRRWIEALRARLLRRCDLVIAVSESVREQSIRRGLDASRVTTVFTGIDLEECRPSVERHRVREALGFVAEDLVIGCVARLHPEKGHALLIEAFARVCAGRPRARLLLVGDGPLGGALRADVARRGLGDRVTFVPFQDDIASLLCALDVFALPSLAEGTPLVIYTAMAADLPIVASKVGGVSELLTHEENGMLTEPGDVNALADALRRVTGDEPDVRAALGHKARRTAERDPRCSVQTSTRSLELIYETVLNPQVPSTAGERWVERYLMPVLRRHLLTAERPTLTCLQIEPDDETEAIRLRRDGHRCDVVLLDGARIDAHPWQERPLVRNRAQGLGDDGAYDLILTGYFGRIGGDREGRTAFARELARVCRKGGAVLTAIGNRWCPVDLTGNAACLHGPFSPTVVTVSEIEKAFLDGGFEAVDLLTLSGHFGMSKAKGPLKPLAQLLDAYWRWVAAPRRRWLYASALNPTLMLWARK